MRPLPHAGTISGARRSLEALVRWATHVSLQPHPGHHRQQLSSTHLRPVLRTLPASAQSLATCNDDDDNECPASTSTSRRGYQALPVARLTAFYKSPRRHIHHLSRVYYLLLSAPPYPTSCSADRAQEYEPATVVYPKANINQTTGRMGPHRRPVACGSARRRPSLGGSYMG